MSDKPVILIVDDQDDNRFAIKLALKNEGYDFIEAENGLQALEIIEKRRPSIVLMDAIMPEMDGFEATKALRRDTELERTPILMITALSEKEDRIKALEAGVSDFISKPFDKHELIARCRSYVTMVQLNSKYIDATQNPASGLPNRGALQSDITKMGNPLVIVCSIDGYDNLTEFYSEEVLHRMEEEFVKLFVRLFPLDSTSYMFYHPTGGIFALAMDKMLNTDLSKESISTLLQGFYEKIRACVIEFEDYEFTPLITFGVSIGGTSPYEHAKTALKEAQKQRVALMFAGEVIEKVHKETENNIYWIKKIKAAILEDCFIPYFQPIYNNHTNTIEKYECLIRMIDENGDVVSPYHFLEISKKAKYYHQLTKIMIDKSMKVFEERKEEFSINLAGGDVENEEVRMYILERLKEKPDVAKRMVFELLEDEGFDSFEILTNFIREVKPYGVKIAVDDFGSGYSNFTRLMDFQPDILKLDGSLIKNINTDAFSLDIVSTMQSFAGKIGIKTVAEFVSTKEVYEKIKGLGVDYSQGYYISAPISFDELKNT